LAERNAELAILDTVQRGLASRMGFEEIVDLVGGKIREVFDAQVVFIGIYDRVEGVMRFPYAYARGETAKPAAATPRGFSGVVLTSGKTVVVNEDMDRRSAEVGSTLLAGTETPKSGVYVPILRGDEVQGVISLQNYDRENAFPPPDVRMLETLAGSMGVALENARLFNETQRLFKQEQQRAAELVVINTVQRGLAAQVDEQAMIELVGEQVREVFGLQNLGIRIYDAETGLVHYPYDVERGVRMPAFDPIPAGGFSGHIIKARQPLLINQDMDRWMTELGSFVLPGTESSKSFLGVPILNGDRVIGTIILEDPDRENAFGESDVRLLTTLASSMSVAFENARLFNETHRRADELAAINEIGREISATLDLPTVLGRITAHARRLLLGDSAAVFLLEPDGETLRAIIAEGAIAEAVLSMRPRRGAGIVGTIVETGQPEIINNTARDPRAVHIPGTTVEDEGKKLIAAPLLSVDQARGVMTVWRDADKPVFTQADLTFLMGIARQAAIAIENARLFEEIQRQKEYSESLVQSSPVAIVRIDLEEKVLSWNPAAEKLFGYTAEEVVGRNIDELVTPEGMREEASTYNRKAMLDGNRIQVTARRRRKGGRLVDVEILGVPVTDQGRPAGAIAIYHDITERKSAEAALLEQKQYLEAVVQNSPVAIVTTDLAANVVSWNPAAERLFRYPAGEAIGQNLDSLIADPSRIGEAVQYTDQVWREGRVHAVTQRARRDRTLVDVELLALPVEIDGRHVGLIAIYHDITERMRAEEELRRQKQYFEDVVQNSPVAIVTTDEVPRVVSWNPAAQTLFGYTAEEAIGRNVDDLVAQDPGIRTQAEDYNQLAAQGLLHEITQRTRKDGTRVDVELSGVPVMVNGRQVGLIAIYHDITELKRAEQAVREQKQYLEAVVQNSPAAIVTIDLTSRVVAWNPTAEKLFGFAADEAIGKDIDDLVANAEELHAQAVKYNQQASSGELVRAITQRTRKDGAWIDVEVLALPVNVEGHQVGTIVIYHDISELVRARQAAESANLAKSAFLATMSHEIRTPMNAVIGMSGLLLDTPLQEEQREYAEIIRASGDALLTIINDILDFSKIEAGKMELESQPFDLRECVEGALDLVAGPAFEKGIDLAYTIEDGVPTSILGDVTRLRQILLNLLTNAVKFTETGEVVLAVAARPLTVRSLPGASTPGRAEWEIRFSVRDTGIGIPPERMGRLFQSFSQVDASTARRYGGTGLGLAISKRLCELMGGAMGVESQVGVGTIFNFSLRTRIPEGEAVPVRRDLRGMQPPLEGKRLLVVDDNETNRLILARQTQKWGMESRPTGSPGEALEWIRRGDPFDVAILDMHMPEMDGLALAGEIRKVRDPQALPLLLFTSLGRREAGEAAIRFEAHLTKPIKPSQLFDALVGVFAGPAEPARAGAAARGVFDGRMAESHPLRILLAEDNAVNQKLALRLLQQMGYRADVAGNGIEAVDALDRQSYDVILMDVQMPEMDGLEASRQICQRWAADERPRIVAMTANAMEGDREMCLQAGMDDYITKPIRPDALVAVLREASPRSSRSRNVRIAD
jgi:PAS domain S-box-containing protein